MILGSKHSDSIQYIKSAYYYIKKYIILIINFIFVDHEFQFHLIFYGSFRFVRRHNYQSLNINLYNTSMVYLRKWATSCLEKFLLDLVFSLHNFKIPDLKHCLKYDKIQYTTEFSSPDWNSSRLIKIQLWLN